MSLNASAARLGDTVLRWALILVLGPIGVACLTFMVTGLFTRGFQEVNLVNMMFWGLILVVGVACVWTTAALMKTALGARRRPR